jgi:hypothetical protein
MTEYRPTDPKRKSEWGRIEEIKTHHKERSQVILRALRHGPQSAFQLMKMVRPSRIR